MDLSQEFTYTFSVEQVVCLRMFLKQGISKLGQGEFRDQMERLKNDFEEKLLHSQWRVIENNKPF